MKVFMCIVFAALFGGIAVYAKTLENEELLEEIKQLLETDSQALEHQQGVGEHVARSLETRGKKKNKNKKKKPKNKNKNKKKPNNDDNGNSGENGDTGNTGDTGGSGMTGGTGKTVTLPNGVKQHPSVTVYQDGKPHALSIKDGALHCHNVIRGIYGVPPLVWDDNLAKSAQKHADALAKAGKLYHSTGNYGENVGYHSISIKGTVYSPAFTCFDWWVECQKPGYDYNNPGFSSGTGHFTQVVWKGSQKIGCAESSFFNEGNKFENTYLVCQYYPPGNYKGQFETNVPRPKKPLPKKTTDVAKEGCCDYCADCGKYGSMCSKYEFLREACCDTCS